MKGEEERRLLLRVVGFFPVWLISQQYDTVSHISSSTAVCQEAGMGHRCGLCRDPIGKNGKTDTVEIPTTVRKIQSSIDPLGLGCDMHEAKVLPTISAFFGQKKELTASSPLRSRWWPNPALLRLTPHGKRVNTRSGRAITCVTVL